MDVYAYLPLLGRGSSRVPEEGGGGGGGGGEEEEEEEDVVVVEEEEEEEEEDSDSAASAGPSPPLPLVLLPPSVSILLNSPTSLTSASPLVSHLTLAEVPVTERMVAVEREEEEPFFTNTFSPALNPVVFFDEPETFSDLTPDPSLSLLSLPTTSNNPSLTLLNFSTTSPTP